MRRKLGRWAIVTWFALSGGMVAAGIAVGVALRWTPTDAYPDFGGWVLLAFTGGAIVGLVMGLEETAN